MVILNNKYCLCIMDYHSKFPICKKGRRHVHRKHNTSMHGYVFRIWIAKKKMSDAGANSISDKLTQFCKFMSTEQVT